jgi:hypothetical protein
MEPTKDHHIKETLERVINHNFNLHNADSIDQQIMAVQEKKDYSFVVGYYLMAHNEEKILKEEIKKNKETKSYEFTFDQLKRFFSDSERAKKIQEVFTYYIIELPNTYSRKPWRVGFSLSTNIKKIFKLIIKAANTLKIKLEKVAKESYRLRCLLQEDISVHSNDYFFVEVFDNTDEYVVDFINENIPSIKFILTCSKFIKLLKS